MKPKGSQPDGRFLTFDLWEQTLDGLILAYNSKVQNGSILDGRSPDAAFDEFWPRDNPPKEFDADCWHLGAHYVSRRKVGDEGIEFRIGKDLFRYRDKNTASHRGKEMLAWFDPRYTDLLGVTDLKERHPFTVQREQIVHPFAAYQPADSRDRQVFLGEDDNLSPKCVPLGG